ncbi:hypothetical protein ACE38V_10270 [Cytobacillus sp. Hz8]|uniref:hypothetical protein n=1 Tax=Cytobacillus sp. Hz8 TaxID=3347168 RepID=UPI0035D7B3EA
MAGNVINKGKAKEIIKQGKKTHKRKGIFKIILHFFTNRAEKYIPKRTEIIKFVQ